jgi:hypothetical protein
MKKSQDPTRWELRFNPLYAGGRGFVFPCDALGQVDMGALSQLAFNNYLYARAMMGREVTWPDLRQCTAR